MAGVGNATAGSLIADGIKSVFSKEESKPATKGDVKRIESLLNQRYHEIANMQPNFEGKYPFYDMHTMSVVYLK